MIESITIRLATTQDLAALDVLFARAYPKLLRADYAPSVMVTAIPLLARAQPRLIASGSFFVAEGEDGTLRGAGGWTQAQRQARGDVRHVVTDDRYVRQGIGRMLFGSILETAKKAGLQHLDCMATYTAVPFYEAIGFQEVGPISVPLRPGIMFPAVKMTRHLSS